MKNSKISIIILNWNGLNDTLECLDSVKKIDYPNFNVIVVDNGSTDNSVEVIKKRFPDVALIATGRNLGFAEGNNVGVTYAMSKGADYILLLNNDTIVDAQLLSSLVEAAEQNPDAGIFGAKIYYYSEPDKIWYAGARWIKKTLNFEHIGWGEIDDGKCYDEIVEIDYACGCALFARVEMIKKIGLMEPRFFLTHEESDWCYQAIRAGHKTLFVPKAKVWHKISVSFGGSESPLFAYFMSRNRLLWAKRNLSLEKRLQLYKKVFAELVPKFVFNVHNNYSFFKRIYWGLLQYQGDLLRRYNNPNYRAQLLGVRDYFLGRFGDCPEKIRGTIKK
jgi:GT2 family glycosyltransferase